LLEFLLKRNVAATSPRYRPLLRSSRAA